MRPKYAKFDIAEPPLVLSLIPGSPGAGSLNHVGLRVRNLFDEHASEPSPTEVVPSGAGSLMPGDFPLEERSYHLTARLRF